jgi:GntR family transcriptional regulator
MIVDNLSGLSSQDIDKDVPIPLHYQLREILKGEINSGRWRVGAQLPSERELCEKFDLSRTTVREAIDALVNDGLLRRERGRGTFVAEPKILEGLLQTPTGFTDSMHQQGYNVVTKVLSMEIGAPPPSVIRELRLDPDEKVTIIERLRFVLDEPILLVTSYVPVKLAPDLINEDLSTNSLYQLLIKKYNLTPYRAKRYMESVAAIDLEARHLQIRTGAPLMLIESTAYLQDGTPLEYFKARHRGDRTRFLVETQMRILPESFREEASGRSPLITQIKKETETWRSRY